jgi:hypothetical protein
VRLLGTVQIPDPFSLYARRYGLELEYYQTKLDYETLLRRSYADLYETFLTQAEIDRENRRLAENDVVAQQFNLSRQSLATLLDENDRAEVQANRRERTLQRRITRLLNSPKRNFRLLPETLPELNYKDRYQELSFRDGFGRLALKQTAGEIESARAQLWRVKVNRYPSINVNVSLPTIYDSQAPNDPEFDDIRLFSGANKSFDFTGREERSVRSAEERAKYIRDRIQIELATEAESFDQLKFQYSSYLENEARIQEQLAWFEKHPPQSSASLITSRIQEVDKLEEELTRIQSYRRRLELEFWVWDEAYWNSPF